MDYKELADLVEENLQEILEHDDNRPEELKNGNGIITHWALVVEITPINPDTNMQYYTTILAGRNNHAWMTKGLLLEALDILRGISPEEEN